MKKIFSLIVLILVLTLSLVGCGVTDTVQKYYIEQEPVVSFNEETNDMTVVLRSKTESLTNILKAKATRVRITFTSLKASSDGTYQTFKLQDINLSKESNTANPIYVTLETPTEDDKCGYPLTQEVEGQTVSTFTDNYYDGKYAMKFVVLLSKALDSEDAKFIKEEKFVKMSITLLKGYDVISAKDESYVYLDTTGTYYTSVDEYKCKFVQGDGQSIVRVYDGYSLNDLEGYSICDKKNVIDATWYLYGKDQVNDIYNYIFRKENLDGQAEFVFNGTQTYTEEEDQKIIVEDEKEEEKEEEGSAETEGETA